MIQVQIVLNFQGNDQNDIQLNVMEREDANDQEREYANAVEELFKSVLYSMRDQLGADQVVITEIPAATARG